MLATVARRHRVDAAITTMASDSAFTLVVTRLSCLRGVSTLTAVGLAVEIGNWHRLDGRSIGTYLGLIPSESSSGGSRSQGRSPRPATVTHDVVDRSWVAPPQAPPPQGRAAPPTGPGEPGGARP